MKKSKKLTLTAFLSILLLSLTSCDTEEISDRIVTLVQNMLPNIWIALMQLALFIIVVVLFIVLAYKPLKKKLSKRSDYIEKNIKDSEEKVKEASANLEKSNQLILDSEKKAGEIVQAAQKTAEVRAQESEKELSTKIEIAKAQAHKDIETERNNMLKDAHKTIVDSAITTSKEILKRDITKEDNDKFVSDFVDELLKKKEKHLSAFYHPKKAVDNADTIFILTDKEKDIIYSHMFPLIPNHVPKYMESWVVSIVDKCVASYEFATSYSKTFLFKIQNALFILAFVAGKGF